MAPLGWGVPAPACPGCCALHPAAKRPRSSAKVPAPLQALVLKPWLWAPFLHSLGRGAGCEAGAAQQPHLACQQFPTELPMDFIPCIFSFSRAFSSISLSKAADPFSSVPPPGS